MRQPGTACRQCRRSKRRCNRPVNEACQPCIQRQVDDCSSRGVPNGTRRVHPGVPTSFDQSRPDGVSGYLDKDCIITLVELYVTSIHDGPHSLFHVPTLRASVQDGSLSKPLLYAILSLAARFADREDLRALGPKFRAQSSNLLKNDLETLSTQSVQAWIVLGNSYGADCEWATESLYFGIAIRSAHIIRLHESRPSETAVEQEVRSRVWWSLYMLDRWSAAGLGTPRQMADRHITQQLPQDEHVFHTLSASQQHWPEPRRLGMWAYMITLVEVFGPIQDFNRTLSTGSMDIASVTDTVARLGSRLEHWRQSLPPELALSPQTFELHQQRGHGRTFVALHLGYYHYGSLLYFSYLDGSAAHLPLANLYAQRCRDYASALSDLLRTSYEMESCEAMYNIVGHMAVVSSSVLIHTLLLGDQRELENAKGRLESNFRIIMKLKSWWPSVDRMKARLFMFQKACLRTIDQRTHRVDHWMVKFLLEHGSFLDERSQPGEDTPSPQDVPGTSPATQAVFERSRVTRNALSTLN